MKQLFLAALILIAFTSVEARQGDLNGKQWTLTNVRGLEVTSALAYLQIDEKGQKFTGSTGCNRMFGSVSLKGNRISFNGVATTKMKCVIDKGEVAEAEFISALKETYSFRVKGNELRLRDSSGKVTLRFKQLAKLPPVIESEPASVLHGEKWMLESTSNSKAVESGAYIRFDREKSSVGGDSGCNVFGGEYTQEADKIKIKDVISTLRACVEDDRMSMERELFDGLRAADRFEIRGGKLLLFKGTKLLLVFKRMAS